MGSSQKEAKARVDVVLDTTIFLPGENITGKINILPKDQNDIQRFTNPEITFSILQQQNWQCFLLSENQDSSSNGQKDVNYFCEKTNNFSEFKDRKISEGIQIPFLYIIPNDINPSFEWPHTKYEFAYIRNFFCVKIPELEYETQILIIIQKPPNKLQSPLTVKAEEAQKKYILFDAGKIIIEGSYPKSSYPALGTIPLNVLVDTSKSEFKIKEITIKLKRSLEFRYKKSKSSKIKKLELLYYETKKMSGIKENILFNIPFKDGNDIEYYTSNSTIYENQEMFCLLPNVDTDMIKVCYYIKIIAVVDGLLAKNIELKMMVDFQSKDEKSKNKNVFDFFGKRVTLINGGNIKLNNDEPYLNHNNNNSNILDFNSNKVFIGVKGDIKKNIYNNINNNNINNNNNFNMDNAYNNGINNNQNNLMNYNINNNLVNNSNNNFENNKMNLPKPPEEDDLDLPSLEELERGEYYKNKYKKLEYPQI